MADPMTREKLRDLLSDMECGAGPDGGDIMAACDDLIAQERAEAERLRAEQVQGIEQAVHAFFADADQRGVHLDGMTVTELCDAVMAAIRALGGTEAGR